MITVLFIWLLFGGFFGGFVQMLCHGFDNYSDDYCFSDFAAFYFSAAHYFASEFYDKYCESMNRTGLIIAITSITIAMLPGSIVLLAMCLLMWIIYKLWTFYKFVFRRKEKGEQE